MSTLRTLVLNNQYMPVSLFPLHTIPAEEAIQRYLNGNCSLVSTYDKVIGTPSRTDLKWPSVIANHNSHSFKKELRLKPEILYYRDHCKCMYCGKDLSLNEITYDHVKPRSKGGLTDLENIVAACKKCNNAKGDSVSSRWKPIKMPWKPNYYQMIDIRKKYPIVIDDESWRPFLPNWASDVIVRNEPFTKPLNYDMIES
jgi:5-methylcytosine-specific restriction endonuclease McrA